MKAGAVGANAAVRTPGGAEVVDPRRAQAEVLWDKGWGRELGCRKFKEYLASIPKIPTFPIGYGVRFPHLVLVDQRITLTKVCRLLGVRFDGDDQTFGSYDPTQVVTTPVYWMRCQDGRTRRNWKCIDCREEFARNGEEVGLSAFEGLSYYAQHPEVIDDFSMELLGSVYVGCHDDYARLKRWDGGVVKLSWNWDGAAGPCYGFASRGSTRGRALRRRS